MIHKLILGTAGLGGVAYGRNQRTVTPDAATTLIREALACGITQFDTSPAYGNAESILRHTLRGRGEVFTKALWHNEVCFAASRTGADLAHVLLHNWKPRWFHRWRNVQLPSGFAGVTTYSHDLPRRMCYDQNFVQVDWNLLQQTRFANRFASYTTIIARSVLLQGALADGPVPEQLKHGVARAARCAAAFNVPLRAFALRSALEHPQIDSVVIGPTTVAELHACVNVAQWSDLGTRHVIEHLDLRGSRDTDPRTFP